MTFRCRSCRRFVDLWGSGLGLVGIIFALAIYGTQRDNGYSGAKHPQCEYPYLPSWFVIYALTASPPILVVLFQLPIRHMALKAAVGGPEGGKRIIGALYFLIALLAVNAVFLISWWIVGNVWIWSASVQTCGTWVTLGRSLLYFHYIAMGFQTLLWFCSRANNPQDPGEGVSVETVTPPIPAPAPSAAVVEIDPRIRSRDGDGSEVVRVELPAEGGTGADTTSVVVLGNIFPLVEMGQTATMHGIV